MSFDSIDIQTKLEKLKHELELYQKAIDDVAHVLITDGYGTITYVNDKYCNLTKYSREELIGQNNRIFKTDYHNPEFFTTMYQELYKGNVFKTKFKNRAKDGSYFWMDATIIPFLDENNVPYQFLAIRFDITDKIQDVNRKEKFLADISHEIRSPLHGLQSMVNLLSETSLNNEQTDYIKHINETSHHLGSLVNNLLDIFKMDAGKLQFEIIPINIRELVISMVDLFSYNEKKSNIKFYHRIDENIQATYLGDPTRLRQILYNLLGNATKFTLKGSISVQVHLIGEEDDYHYLEFQIIDTGIGIPPEKQEGVFDKFMQSEVKDTRLYGGTGLGLNIVKNLIQLLDGCFSLKSKLGIGTTFMFTLPLKKQTPPDVSDEQSFIVSEQPHKILNILIVEDDKINQLIYKKQMLKFNHTFKVADNGFEALDYLLQESFDLVILDMLMPGMNGDEVLKKIRGEFPEPVRDIPVICISATVHPKTIQDIIDAGADGHLSKPYKEHELADMITRTLSTSSGTKKVPELNNQPSKTVIISLEHLNQFADGDTDFIIELLEYFNSTTPQVLESMQLNFSTKNNELPKQLHKYRSQVSLMGLTELTELTLTLETALMKVTDFRPYRNDFEKLLVLSQEVVLEVALLITKLKNQ